MRAALYTRVSRAEKEQDPENQLIKLRAFSARQGWEVYDEYVDYASGMAPSRPSFDKMMNEARGRHFDMIVVVRLDRLARSTSHLLNICEELKHYGVAFMCSDQPFDTASPVGKILFTLLGAVAEFELDLIRERTKDGLARARAKGKLLGRPPNKEAVSKILVLRAEGLSLSQIGKEMGLSHSAVRQRLRRYRLQKRDQEKE